MNCNIDWSASDNSEDESLPTTAKARCNFCSIILKSAADVSDHEKNDCKIAKTCSANRINCKNGISKFVCDICYRTFKSLRSLVEHTNRHEPPGGFICKFCNERYCTAGQLDNHTEEVHKVYSCQICKATFETTSSYINHVQKIHYGQQKQYTSCENCGRQFYDQKILKFHIETNCGADKKFKCTECEKRFINKYLLKAHMDIHSGKREFFCSYCGEGFLKKGSLEVHERKHTGEKPYKCSVCSKCFAHRQSLVTHSSLHTGIKPYYCECCESRFSCTGNLIAHRKKRPDTCGQPQYCTKLAKICPRPSIYNPQHLTSVEPIKIAKSQKILKSREQKQNEKERREVKCKKNYKRNRTNEVKQKSDTDTSSKTKIAINKNLEKEVTKKLHNTKKQTSIQLAKKRKPSRIIKNKLENIASDLELLINAKLVNKQFEKFPFPVKDVKQDIHEIQRTEYGNEFSIKKECIAEDKIDNISIKDESYETPSDLNLGLKSAIKYKKNLKLTGCRPKNTSKQKTKHINEDSSDDELLSEVKKKSAKKIRENSIKCIDCKNKSFAQISSFESHLRKNHEKSENEIESLLEEIKNSFLKRCNICNKSYSIPSALRRHIKAHGPNGNLTHRCRACYQYFFTSEDVKIHMQNNHKDRLTCKFCNKIFHSIDYVSQHIRFKHKGEKKPTKPQNKKYLFMCNKCGKVLSSKSLLNNHEASDCGKNPIHICNICGKGLTTAGILKSHMLLHTGELSYSCNFCGKGFRNKYQRNEHERVHTGEQPFQCTYCDQRFSHRTNLFIHLSTHTGNKRYRCTGCGDRFSCISGLKAHWKTYSSTCGTDPNKTTKPIGEYMGFRKGKVVYEKESAIKLQ